MQRIFTSSWCDWPGCADTAIASGTNEQHGQNTKPIQSWFFGGKGHKPRVIANDLCDEHYAEVMAVRDRLKVNGELIGVDLDG